MKVRYKDTGTETGADRFNTATFDEVLTGDDSAFIRELDVWINGAWKDMRQAFQDRDIIPDNDNEGFAPPINEQARAIGYNP
jgi:hypothetical protein